VLALMFCTTHLHYTQNMMENNYIMLLTLAGFSYQYEWLRTDNRRALFIGSCALGLNLLTRLTTGLDLVAAGIFLLLVLWFQRPAFEKALGRELLGYLIAYARIAAPVYLFFLLIDRVYQFYRFGSFTNTYVTYFAREYRQRDPTLPANFPWSTPFHAGFFGPLFQPEKSIFLFDPLLLLAIFLLAWLWKRLTPEVRAYGTTSLLLLVAYICFYARYTYWSGDFAWGDRYVSTAVEMATLVAVPIVIRNREILGRTIWRASGVLIVDVLFAVGDLSDGDPRTSNLRDCSPLQKYLGLHLGQDVRLGLDQRQHDRGPLGLCSHQLMEFPALSVASRRSSAAMGGRFGVRHLDGGARGTRIGFTPVTKHLANRRVKVHSKARGEKYAGTGTNFRDAGHRADSNRRRHPASRPDRTADRATTRRYPLPRQAHHFLFSARHFHPD
jgi:hypothetical protein